MNHPRDQHVCTAAVSPALEPLLLGPFGSLAAFGFGLTLGWFAIFLGVFVATMLWLLHRCRSRRNTALPPALPPVTPLIGRDQSPAIGGYKTQGEIAATNRSTLVKAIWNGSGTAKECVVKLSSDSLADSPPCERFQSEISILSKLSGTFSAQLLDSGLTDTGQQYLTLEYLRGFNLSQVIDQFGPQCDGRVAAWLYQLCRGLDEVHNLGKIHRDIKPANIMLTVTSRKQDLIKIVDFGLASDPAIAAGAEAPPIAGTPAFMPPEAAQPSVTLDARSDLYSLGCVGFYLLSGRPPLMGQTPIETCWMQINVQPPNLRDLCSRASVSDEMIQIVNRCLSKAPESRPASAIELQGLLNDAVLAQPWTMDESSRWWKTVEDADR